MWVGIVGSRTLGQCACDTIPKSWPPTPEEKVHQEECPRLVEWLRMLKIVARLLANDPEVGIVSGGAAGADTLAMEAAILYGIPKARRKVYEPKQGREPFWVRAKARNQQIVDLADMVIAVFAPGPRSRGTMDTIERAQKKGIPLHIWDSRWVDE